jgi:hypothetical protein
VPPTVQQRREANAVLAEAFSLAQFYLAYRPAAERGMLAAQESEDPTAIAGAAWLLAQAHRDAGDWDAADHVNLEALRMLEPLIPGGGTDLRAMTGALYFEAAYTAARAGRNGNAWHYWDKAKHVADHLPASYTTPDGVSPVSGTVGNASHGARRTASIMPALPAGAAWPAGSAFLGS